MVPGEHTELIVVLDRSGSMELIRTETVRAFNGFLEDQHALPGDVRLTFVQFDDDVEVLYESCPLDYVPTLTEMGFVPQGKTALHDAIGHTLEHAQRRLMRGGEGFRPNASVVFAVLTDGVENASRRYHREHVCDLVAQSRQAGWRLMYFGADAESVKDATAYGINPSNIFTFHTDPGGITQAMQQLSDEAQGLEPVH